MSKKELAQVLGISISTLSRALDSLKDQGIISVLNKKEITLMMSDKK
ncbi:helix-turn-helix domain-containing protein [Citrobacter braakii]